jgi:hypothetical protein
MRTQELRCRRGRDAVNRKLEVDGETVEFHMVLTPDPMRTEPPEAYKQQSDAPVYRALGATSAGTSVMLEQPPSKAHLDEYSDGELEALWRQKKRVAGG